MAKYTLMQQLFTMDGLCHRKGEFLAENATPLCCADVLMKCIANSIKELSDSSREETSAEASLRFKIARDYVRVLDYMLAQMESEIVPALNRLHMLVYPEDDIGGNA